MTVSWDMDGDREILALRAQLELLVEILINLDVLSKGHRKILEKLALASSSTVRLHVYEDKYRVPGPDIDCDSLIPLCKARCCSFNVPLSVQDLEEGELPWDWETPYVLSRGDDGYCSQLRRAEGGCQCYDKRPVTCRHYDCRQDRRVWLDFEKKIPAPLPEHLEVPPFCAGEPG